MSGSTIFVGGIHGAGKTTISRKIAGLLGASHITAGGLIRENGCASETVTVGLKTVSDVDANQMLLLRGLALYRVRSGPGPLILDGHFVVLDAAGGIAEIPLAVYEAITPVAVLLVEAGDLTIHARLLERDGEAPALSTIAELARRERVHAERVCARLNLPVWPVAGEAPPDQEAAAVAMRIKPIVGGAV